MRASEDEIRLPEKTEYQDRLDQAKEQRGMVQGLKDLFKGGSTDGLSGSTLDLSQPDPASYTGEDRRVKDRGLKSRARDAGLEVGALHRATDDPTTIMEQENRARAQARTGTFPDPPLPRPWPEPGPWAGVPAAIQTLRPLGRYDRVTDDAWRLVKAFCEARAQEPGDQGQGDS